LRHKFQTICADWKKRLGDHAVLKLDLEKEQRKDQMNAKYFEFFDDFGKTIKRIEERGFRNNLGFDLLWVKRGAQHIQILDSFPGGKSYAMGTTNLAASMLENKRPSDLSDLRVVSISFAPTSLAWND
jgi:hypothetical protein